MKNGLMLVFLGATMFLAGGGSTTRGGTIQIHPSQDNTIYSENNNSNALGDLFAGETSTKGDFSLRRALLEFNLAGSGIPAGSTINSVSLALTQMKIGPASTSTFELLPLLDSWGQGTSGGTEPDGGKGFSPTSGDATWNYRFFSTTHWTTPGGDFGSVSGTATFGTADTVYTFSSQPGLVADVQRWLSTPTSNFGWILRAVNESPGTISAREFGSMKSSLAQQPTLTVTFTPPVSGPAAWLTATSGNWSNGANWTTGAAPDGPGQVAVLNKTTTAALTVTLDKPETVGTLEFGNSGGDLAVGYTLSGTNALTLDNSGSTALLTVSQGKHAISTPVTLADNLNVSPSAGSTLDISGNISQGTSGLSLTLSNSGSLILSGSNNYGGGTTVKTGTLYVTNSHAIADRTSLTAGAGGTFIFEPSVAGSPIMNSAAAVAVPEPGTLTLFSLAVCGAPVYQIIRSRRKNFRRRSLLSADRQFAVPLRTGNAIQHPPMA
ncbi:MAG: DNRLRE domain-containing protein [Thermoguttaceae bacterium]